MAKHPAYGRARVLAVLCAVDLAAMVYFTRSGDLGWVFPLIIVFFILSSSLFEALGYAFQQSVPARAANYYYEDGDEDEIDLDRLIALTQILDEESEAEAEAEIDLEPFSDYWEGDEDTGGNGATSKPEVQGFELTEADKLLLCQFYSFVYAIIQHRVIGEKIWTERGMVQLQYRKWIHALASPGVEIVRVEERKPSRILESELPSALNRIADRVGRSDYWAFPLWYFHQMEGASNNWETLYSFKRNGQQEPPLLPCYPTKLKTAALSTNNAEQRR